MRPSITDMLRAYLIPASLAAAFTEAASILSLLLFRISEAAFQSLPFQMLALVVIVAAVALTRRHAHRAFREAVAARYISYHDHLGRTLYLSPACPKREWVMLHLRFRRIAFHLASLDSRPLLQASLQSSSSIWFR